ncbi:3'(2'),5'-bisphosphate nucleotidase CysQ [Woodsholea maritima]|uniref:3'(2'),5'-bisphosphate nucleotidase CysQ n=1 Tax=Woodsholea maritima TaxID=240237 RepID=UPI000364EE46|nr:3'(2'),5'-bisphosphate nucleotidase CysQ [Woodsholea maritima]
MTDFSAQALSELFARICLSAGPAVMEVYHSDFTPEQKADKSPVTLADQRAEAIILDALQAGLPDIPVLAEESFAAGLRPDIDGDFILVDPVDGTKEFINKRDEFTINIAYIRDRHPLAGAVYAPAKARLYWGGEAAYALDIAPGESFSLGNAERLHTQKGKAGAMIAVMSRSHADEETLNFAKQAGVSDTVSAGSSLKFCLLAEGKAHLYPRFGPTMEWDTAAGHGVLNAAGGSVTNPDGTPFLYGKTDAGYLNAAFIARG